jgi:hypothetical protein
MTRMSLRLEMSTAALSTVSMVKTSRPRMTRDKGQGPKLSPEDKGCRKISERPNSLDNLLSTGRTVMRTIPFHCKAFSRTTHLLQ